MKDTDPRVEDLYNKMLLALSGEERLRMASSMFTTAREMALSSLQKEHPEATDSELRGLLFLRMYKSDFSREERDKIYRRILDSHEEAQGGGEDR